jgi:hypothetical protein
MEHTHSSRPTPSLAATINSIALLQSTIHTTTLTTFLPTAHHNFAASHPTILGLGFRQHAEFAPAKQPCQHGRCRREVRCAAEGAGETALVKYRYPITPYPRHLSCLRESGTAKPRGV